MNLSKRLKKLAKDLNIKSKKYIYLICIKREIIIRNFLGGCPDPLYIKYKNKYYKNRPKAIIKFLKSNDYKKDNKKPHGCVISKKEIKRELKLIPKIPDEKLRKEIKEIYYKINKKIGNRKKLTLIWKPSKKEKKIFKNILFHEFVHELLEDNKLAPKSWKWDEGLVTFLTNKPNKFEKKPSSGKNKMWEIYGEYAHKWAKILKDIKDPKIRKKLIIKKIKSLN